MHCILLVIVHFLSKDIDECLEDSGVCGFGSCTNNDGGNLYVCDCVEGAVLGTNSMGLPTCLGLKGFTT